MRIGIIGAGGTGACAALELANRGHHVDLYDENPEPVTRASYSNEGKIHLGLVYAKDTSLKTAELMIRGSLHFRSRLARWIDLGDAAFTLSEPYYYAVHAQTMTPEAELAQHYARCKRLFEGGCSESGLSYVDGARTLVAEKLSRAEMEQVVDGEHFSAVFRTSERAVDPRGVARLLREAVAAHPRIRFVGCARVSEVAWTTSGRLTCSFELTGQTHTETYDQLANTSWHGRLAIDAGLGLAPPRSWIYRYKLGGWMAAAPGLETVPSLTIVLGPFGDIVNLGSGGVYLSWYPIGMIATSRDLVPPDWHREISIAAQRDGFHAAYRALQALCPRLGAEDRPRNVEPCGGVIFAWGDTDIDHHQSALHGRYQIGIHTVRNYHTVNTGKYTMVPYLGYETAERILASSR